MPFSAASGTIRAGVGGWTFRPWEGTFYPDGLARARQLHYASRQLATIEINATFYRGQTPRTFAKWAAEVPDGFVFAVKGHKAVTIRKALGEAGDALQKFFATGVAELGPALGPLVWQLAPSKRFDADEMAAFLALLPAKSGGVALRHVLEVRHASFAVPEFVALARARGVAIAHAHHETYPEVADVTADFVYSRLQRGEDSVPTAYPTDALDRWAARARVWAEGGAPDDLARADPSHQPRRVPRDVFFYFIHEGKVRAPQAAMAFMERVRGEAATGK